MNIDSILKVSKLQVAKVSLLTLAFMVSTVGVVQIASAAPTVAESKQQQGAVQKLTGLLKDVQTMKASFQQDTLDNGGRRLQSSSGSMVLKRPEMFRWLVEEPFPQEVVSDGRKVSYYDKDMEQVTIQSLNLNSSATPAMLLSGDTKAILANFSVRLSAGDGRQMFTLTPKDLDNSFQDLYLTFEKGALSRMVLIDSLGSRTNIQFSGVKLNEPVSDKFFVLNIPDDVDVIDQRTETVTSTKVGTSKGASK